MLEWNLLTSRQKFACALFSVVALLGFIAMLFNDPPNASTIVRVVSFFALFAAVLLNPTLVRGDLSGLLTASMPRICKVLAFSALALHFLSNALQKTV
jgi:hypothetical protein